MSKYAEKKINNCRKKLYKYSISLFLMLALFQTVSYAQNSKNDSFNCLKKIIICKYLKDGKPFEPTTNFSIDDKIYVLACWQNVKGTHTAEAYWYDPQNKLRSAIPVSFKSQNGFHNSWFWFQINQTAWERHFASISSVDSIGGWHVVICLDGKFIQELNFRVG